MRIYLVRHGISQSNMKSTYSEPGTLLAPNARMELQVTKKHLQNISFDKVYTSDLIRTVQTAEILGYPDAIKESRLRERDFGVFVGNNHYQAMQKYPTSYKKYMQDPVDYRIPRGESFHDLCDRVWDFLDELTSRERNSKMPVDGFRPVPGDTSQVLLVTHFNVIASAFCWVIEDRYRGHHLVSDNGGIFLMDIRGPLKTLIVERR